jgi:FtsP/CotA-like multicopper oxidase with cupredoxin domain
MSIGAAAESSRMAVLGQTLELTVTNKTANAHHPFHLHGFSMQPLTLELTSNGSVVYT